MKSKKLFISLLISASSYLFTSGLQAQTYKDISWLELLPEDDKQALLSQGPIQHGNETTMERQPALGANRTSLGATLSNSQVESAWLSSAIIPEMGEEQVRLPGFVVPLEYNDEQKVTEFFLVPYFGACIHMPAPPPNQIIFVSDPNGFELSSIYEPYVVEGEMLIAMTTNELGVSAYSIEAANIFPYKK